MSVSGEMDNGWTATGSLLLTESAALSSSWTSLTMGSLGTIIVGSFMIRGTMHMWDNVDDEGKDAGNKNTKK